MGTVLSTLNSFTNKVCRLFPEFVFSKQQREQSEEESPFYELPEDMIFEIFNRLTPAELLATERVGKNWQRLVRKTLEWRVETVVMRRVIEVDFVWDFCQHLRDEKRTMSLKKFSGYVRDERQRKNKRSLFARKQPFISDYDCLQTPADVKLFTSCLSKLRGVRSINFNYAKISVKTLVQAFKVCPNLECITIEGSHSDEEQRNNLKEDDWIEFINRFGHRLVHLSVYYFLKTGKLLPLLGQLNNLEIISFQIFNLNEEIQVQKLNNDKFKVVNFPNLKKLIVGEITLLTLQVLTRCQFPVLNELKLVFHCKSAFLDNVDQELDQLFKKMPNLVKIDFDNNSQVQQQVPGPSVMRIAGLTEIVWRVYIIDAYWNIEVMADTFSLISQVASLKRMKFIYRIGVYFRITGLEKQWRSAIDQQLNGLKKRRPNLVVETIDLPWYDRRIE